MATSLPGLCASDPTASSAPEARRLSHPPSPHPPPQPPPPSLPHLLPLSPQPVLTPRGRSDALRYRLTTEDASLHFFNGGLSARRLGFPHPSPTPLPGPPGKVLSTLVQHPAPLLGGLNPRRNERGVSRPQPPGSGWEAFGTLYIYLQAPERQWLCCYPSVPNELSNNN